MWKRIKENAAAAVVTVFIGFAAIAQFAIVNPIQQRFDAIDQRFDDPSNEMNRRFDDQYKYINQRFDVVSQRFDAVEERIGRLSGEVSELRRLADRVSRNEGASTPLPNSCKPPARRRPHQSRGKAWKRALYCNS